MFVVWERLILFFVFVVTAATEIHLCKFQLSITVHETDTDSEALVIGFRFNLWVRNPKSRC